MVLDRVAGSDERTVVHSTFRDLPRFVRPRSLFVLNDTQVIPARLVGRKPSGGAVELLLVEPAAGRVAPPQDPPDVRWSEEWEVLGKGLKGVGLGQVLALDEHHDAVLVTRGERGAARVRFRGRVGQGLLASLPRLGRMPLPPYIEAARRREQAEPTRDVVTAEDRLRYQTVYARVPGAVAAPTAGLHFTPALLDQLRAQGHEIAAVTLHVGPGTFRPVEVDEVEGHRMDSERYDLPEATVAAIERARAEGRPIVAVGTTVVRTLEGAARQGGLRPGPGSTDLFLRPGARFEVVTDLVTNFHLPRSTLLMLVAAFAGRENVLAAYRTAVEQGYRFYSYGDAMFISPRHEGRP